MNDELVDWQEERGPEVAYLRVALGPDWCEGDDGLLELQCDIARQPGVVGVAVERVEPAAMTVARLEARQAVADRMLRSEKALARHICEQIREAIEEATGRALKGLFGEHSDWRDVTKAEGAALDDARLGGEGGEEGECDGA